MATPDWEAIEAAYRAGILTLGDIVAQFSVTMKALRYRAEKHQWVRGRAQAKQGQNTGAKQGQKSGAKKAENLPQKMPQKLALTDVKKSPENSQQNTLVQNDYTVFDPDEFGISEQQALFVQHVAAGKPLIEAYRLAEYKAEGNAAYVIASQLLRNPKVARAIRWLRDKRQHRLDLIESEIIHQLVSIANADPNALSQIRRVNCRYCWGEDHRYQWNDMGEFEKAEEKASDDGKEPPEFGGVGFVDSAIPNPDCPKCFGEGSMRTFFADTTQLDGPDRWLFAGVKETMNGLEIKTTNQDAARRELLRIAQANRGRLPGDPAANNPGKEELELERLRLGNEKLQVEIDNIKNGKKENELVIVHNALQIPGAIQPTKEGD